MNISQDKAIAGLDLASIKRKLMRGKPGAEWSRERVDAAENEYRRFLLLMKLFPNELAAPSLDVDRFWHHHIVDTAKYARDCQAVFGYFLHRCPYVGSGGEDETASRMQAGTRMRQLYREIFGQQPETYPGLAATGFAIAVHAGPHLQPRAASPSWIPTDPGLDEPDEPQDLWEQLRSVVIENQRWDRVAEPVM